MRLDQVTALMTNRICAYGVFFNAATRSSITPAALSYITLMAIDILIVMLYYVIVPN